MKEGARNVFPPYSVSKIYEDYADWKYALEQVGIEPKSEKYSVKSPFPPESTDKKEIARPDLIPEAKLKERLDALSVWSIEVIEIIGGIEDEKIQARAMKTFDRFFETTPPPPLPAPEVDDKDDGDNDSVVSAGGKNGKKKGKKKKKKKKNDSNNDYINPVEKEMLLNKDAIRRCVMAGWKEPNRSKAGNRHVYTRKEKKLKENEIFKLQFERVDVFESRFNQHNGEYYLFNPWTGEAIFDMTYVNRVESAWMEPDPNVEKRPGFSFEAMQALYPVFYASRTRGVRSFSGYGSGPEAQDKAAVHLCAVTRGFLARRSLRRLFFEKYEKITDSGSGCYYFRDKETGETSWGKPRLAWAFTIAEPPADLREAPEMQASGFSDGPLLKRGAKGKKATRWVAPKPEVDPESELPTPREPVIPDLKNDDFLKVSLWIDDNTMKLAYMEKMYAAYLNKDFKTIFLELIARPDDDLTQLFGFSALSRLDIDGDPETGQFPVIMTKLMMYLFGKSQEWFTEKPFGSNHNIFLNLSLLHFLTCHAARVEFFKVPEKGLGLTEETTVNVDFIENAALMGSDASSPTKVLEGEVEKHVENQLWLICQHLKNVPMYVTYEQIEKSTVGDMTAVARPTLRGAEVATILLKQIGVLAHERDHRESVAIKAVPFVLMILEKCPEEPAVTVFGLRCLYNFVHKCFEAWRFITVETTIMLTLKKIKWGPLNGDMDVISELRRCELAYAEDGWRGEVEDMIYEEMKEAQKGFVAAFSAKKEKERNVEGELSLEEHQKIMREKEKEKMLEKMGIDEEAMYRTQSLSQEIRSVRQNVSLE